MRGGDVGVRGTAEGLGEAKRHLEEGRKATISLSSANPFTNSNKQAGREGAGCWQMLRRP